MSNPPIVTITQSMKYTTVEISSDLRVIGFKYPLQYWKYLPSIYFREAREYSKK